MTAPDKQALAIAAEARTLLACDRKDFVMAACGGDEALLEEIEALMATDTAPVAFLDGEATDIVVHETLGKGTQIGAFRIDRLIDRGGMGEIYLASRVEGEFDQKVAIKVLQLESQRQHRRFRAERRILAKLEHRNVARILDGGTTPDGRPYFVMEYVEGVPIVRYCDESRLALRERLELLAKICRAVQFAHGHLVVHRDLKPSNILVAADGEPKLLDFGIAEFLDTDRPESQSLGFDTSLTPEYASPEQIAGGPMTTASDVYSLGVILYELLVGSSPYGSFSRTSLADTRRAVCEEEPAKPSLVLAKLAETTDGEIAGRARSIKPEKLARELSGDLDNICAKALRKDLSQRYQSTRELAEDIERYLDRQPVLASSPDAIDRMKKFCIRNPARIALATLLTVSLTITALVMSSRARERARAAQLQSFVVNVFEKADPTKTHDRGLTLQDVLRSAADRLDEELQDQPAARSELFEKLAGVLYQQGNLEAAMGLARRALQLSSRELGERSLAAASAGDALGLILATSGDFQEAEAALQDALDPKQARLESDSLPWPVRRHSQCFTA